MNLSASAQIYIPTVQESSSFRGEGLSNSLSAKLTWTPSRYVWSLLDVDVSLGKGGEQVCWG